MREPAGCFCRRRTQNGGPRCGREIRSRREAVAGGGAPGHRHVAADPTGAMADPDEEDLLCLVYSSKLACTADEANGVVADILATSTRKNPRKHIGGALHYINGGVDILQILEGPTMAVRNLYDIILADTRHQDCKLLLEKKTSGRTFATFGMIRVSNAAMQMPESIAEVNVLLERVAKAAMLVSGGAHDWKAKASPSSTEVADSSRRRTGCACCILLNRLLAFALWLRLRMIGLSHRLLRGRACKPPAGIDVSVPIHARKPLQTAPAWPHCVGGIIERM